MASVFEMTGHTTSNALASSTSKPRINGDETMHQAPKCARFHSRVDHSSFPTIIMSGYPQQPCVASGASRSRKRRTVCRLRTQDHRFDVMSALVRKKANGQCSDPSLRRSGQPDEPPKNLVAGSPLARTPQLPQWQFSIMTLRDWPRVWASISSAHREMFICSPQASSLIESKPSATRVSTSPSYRSGPPFQSSAQMQLLP